jgi:hypothetical protein
VFATNVNVNSFSQAITPFFTYKPLFHENNAKLGTDDNFKSSVTL